jgi:hypothetical protein
MSMKEWMRRTKTKQGEVACATGRSREYVNRLANGKEKPSEIFITDFFFAYGQEATIAAFDEAQQ